MLEGLRPCAGPGSCLLAGTGPHPPRSGVQHRLSPACPWVGCGCPSVRRWVAEYCPPAGPTAAETGPDRCSVDPEMLHRPDAGRIRRRNPVQVPASGRGSRCMRICVLSGVSRPTLAHSLTRQRREAVSGCAISVASYQVLSRTCDGAVSAAQRLPAAASWIASVKALCDAGTIRNSSDLALSA